MLHGQRAFKIRKGTFQASTLTDLNERLILSTLSWLPRLQNGWLHLAYSLRIISIWLIIVLWLAAKKAKKHQTHTHVSHFFPSLTTKSHQSLSNKLIVKIPHAELSTQNSLAKHYILKNRIIHNTDFSNEIKNTAYKVSFYLEIFFKANKFYRCLMGFFKVIRQLKWDNVVHNCHETPGMHFSTFKHLICSVRMLSTALLLNLLS